VTSRNGDAGDDHVVLTLWTADPELASRADAAGIDRVGVDLETLGKASRQAGLGTWITPHREEDLAAVAGRLRRARAFARIDPLHNGTKEQLERVLALGAEVVMLPMFTSAEQVDTFMRLLGGRAEPVLLLEQAEAIAHIGEILDVPGVKEVHVGVNDLSLSLGTQNRFAVLTSNAVRRVAAAVRAAGVRFGIGGIGRVGDERRPIPSDLLYAEYSRLGSTAALISRRFLPVDDLAAEVQLARERLSYWRAAPPSEADAAHRELVDAVAAAGRW
jgi:HpcH/HpaI aldolase/citrate lyase family